MARPLRIVIVASAVLVALVGCSALSDPQSPSPSPSTSTSTSERIVLPPDPAAYFFGDSWTEGYSAAPGKGYAFVAGKALGWQVLLAPDGSGTGYIRVNKAGAPTYPERAETLPARVKADVVVLQGSVNDESGDLSRLDGAVRTTVVALRKRTGDAPIIMLGPAPAGLPISYELYQIDAQLATDARLLGIPYISPIRDKWITSGNIGRIIDSGTGHPNTAGHAYIGRRVAEAIRPLIRGASN